MKRRIVRPVLVAVLALIFGTGGTAFAVDGEELPPDEFAVAGSETAGLSEEVAEPAGPVVPPASETPPPAAPVEEVAPQTVAPAESEPPAVDGEDPAVLTYEPRSAAAREPPIDETDLAAAPVTVELPDYDPDAGTQAGTELAIAGSGFLPGETVTAWFNIEGPVVGTYEAAGESLPSALPAATFRAGDPGTFSGTFVVPSDAEPGEHTVYVSGEDSDRSASVGLVVLAAPDSEPEPVTGEFGEITRDGCLVSIPTITTGAGEFGLIVWDDGSIDDSFTWVMTGDGSHTVLWTITMPAGTGFPGVGFELVDADGNRLDYFDPYVYPDELADSCSAAVPVTVELPDYNPATGTEAGSDLTITGTGFLPGEEVEVTFGIGGPVVGTFTADEDGTFSGTFTVPEDAEDGEYPVVATGVESGRSGSQSVRVGEEPEPAPVTGTIGDITRDGCVVRIPTTTTGAGEFTLDVWDDGEKIDSFTWEMTGDGSHDVLWTITRPAGESAVGVGFELSGSPGLLDSVDPWEYPAEVAFTCSGGLPPEPVEPHPVKPAAVTSVPTKPAPTQPVLAKTGSSNVDSLLLLGAGLLLAGAGGVVARKGRRSK